MRLFSGTFGFTILGVSLRNLSNSLGERCPEVLKMFIEIKYLELASHVVGPTISMYSVRQGVHSPSNI